MAGGNYGPEIRAAMQSKPKGKAPPPRGRNKIPPDTRAEAKAEGDTPQEMARDKARGIVEGSPQDEQLDMQNNAPRPPTGGGVHPHVAAAAGIAHAILAHHNSGGGGY